MRLGLSLPRRAQPWLLMAPALALLAVFFVVPLLDVVWISVSEPAAGLGNYALLVTHPAMTRVLWTTFRISAITTVVALALGYLVAYAMVRASQRQRRLMSLCIFLPFWISVLARAFAWVTLLRANGVVNTLLLEAGLVERPLALIYNELGVVIGMVHYMLPLATLTLYANMRGIDRRLVAAARGLGAGPVAAFLQVFLPLTLPGLLAAGILVLIFSLGFYVTPAVLGGGKTLMAAEYIGVMIGETLNWGQGTMLATTLTVAVFALLAVVSRTVDLKRLFGAA